MCDEAGVPDLERFERDVPTPSNSRPRRQAVHENDAERTPEERPPLWKIRPFSSDIAWRKTHRVGGHVLILLGLALIPLAFYLDSTTNLWVTGTAVVGTALILIIYILPMAKRSGFALIGANHRDPPTLMSDEVEKDLDTAGAAIQTFTPGGLWG
jgi:hypothetical protein